MKTLVQLIFAMSLMLTISYAEDAILPTKELRAEWGELQKLKFEEWSIEKFRGWDVPFDGGSKVFFFESDDGERFNLVVANPGYWTAEDRKERRQVFIVTHKNRYYRIEPNSDEEKNMIMKLADAAKRLQGKGKTDPKLLTSLAKRLESREPVFKTKS